MCLSLLNFAQTQTQRRSQQQCSFVSLLQTSVRTIWRRRLTPVIDRILVPELNNQQQAELVPPWRMEAVEQSRWLTDSDLCVRQHNKDLQPAAAARRGSVLRPSEKQTNYCKEKKITLGTTWRGITRPVVLTLAMLLLELKRGLLGAPWMVVIRERSCHCD